MGDQYDRTLIRLTTAEDEKLEPILAKVLPIIFDELLSQTEAPLRVKIVGVLNHVLTRAKGNKDIKLPALAIAQRWFGPKLATSPGGPFFRNLSVIFMDLSVPRLTPLEQADFATYALEHFAEIAPGADRAVIFMAAIAGLGQIAAEGLRKDQVPRCLELIAARPADDPALVAFFDVAAEFLLIPCGSTEAPAVSGMPSASWAHWKARLKGKTVADMIALKSSVLKWLAALATGPPASLVYLPSLVATVENYDAVVNLAESNCKRLDPELNLSNDFALLGRITSAALTSPPPGIEPVTSGPLRVESKASVPSKMRVKVLSMLQRAKGIGSPGLVAHVVHLIRQSLRDGEQVQTTALQLALVLAEHVEPECLVATSSAILEEVEAVFWPGGGVVAIGTATPLAFKTFGSFARQLAERPSGEGRALALHSSPRMLALLASNEGAAGDILEALSGLVACMRGTLEEDYKEFVPLLDRLVIAPKPVVRREVLRWAGTLFPNSAPEGRYYALRLFGDADPDIARAAETLLSGGGREVPPFSDMCGFLASRALSGSAAASTAASTAEKLEAQAAELAKGSPALPPLSSGFSRLDVARGLSFLLRLAEAEGLRLASEDLGGAIATRPAPKRPRLAESGAASAAAEPLLAFVALLDYLLAAVVEGGSAAVTDEAADGMTVLELSLRGLLLAASLAGSHEAILKGVMCRTELVLLGGSDSSRGTLFREGGLQVGRMRRLGAKVLGLLCEQLAGRPDGPVAGWLARLEEAMGSAAGTARRAGAVLAVCELLRNDALAQQGRPLCLKAIGLLLPGAEEDVGVLSAACDGLRRLSERRPLVWEALDDAGGLATRQSLLDRLYGLSAPFTASATGDAKDVELGTGVRELVHASWRLLGQLAAWGGDGSADCTDRLVAIGRKCVDEESTAALGMALAAAASDPAGSQMNQERVEALLRRLATMANAGIGEDGKEESTGPPTNAEARAALAEKEAEQRCGVVWLTVLLRRLTSGGSAAPFVTEALELLCRALVRAVAGLSIFVADCALKALCHLFCLAAPDARAELMKLMFGSISNRTVVSNMFVGNPDTQARKEAKDAAEAAGPNSLKITAKERVDLLKDLMFLARELGHPALFVGLLDQPQGSVWTGEVLREALDLQMPCLPDELRDTICPAPLRPRLYPYFFHTNAPLRQAVVSLTASYFSVESPQQLASKYAEEWPQISRNLVNALGSSRVNTREAAIGAAQALFGSRTWSEMAPLFEDLWTIVVKLMDDMETKILQAVKPLVRMTRNITLRFCDAKLGSAAEVNEALKVIVPLLLKFCERYKHAQPLCFEVMKEMVKLAHGTPILSPYVQDLVPPLLISLSMMENDSLQYYQFHVDAKSEEKGKELEAARISHSRDSESMKLLRQLVPLVTEENAQAIAPRTRDQLHRGVGANTRVGVCDFWSCVCAERPSAVPVGGAVASSMLRSLAGALLDANREVRMAAASCFASFARRNTPQELTKVINERLLKHDQEYRTDDAARNSFRNSLSRALWEVCRRCDDSQIEVELKAAIAAKAFGLRWSNEQEVKQGWESLWGELCPSTSAGVERYHREICTELASAFSDSVSRAEKMNSAKAVSALCAQLDKATPRPNWAEDAAVVDLHKAVRETVRSLPIFEGNGALVRALADLGALRYRRKRNEESAAEPDEASLGLQLIQGFCSKGSLTDRAAAVRALIEVMSASRLWGALSEVAQIYRGASSHVDELQREVEAEEREPGQAVPKRHRGKGQSPAEEYLSAALDLWATTLQQCRKEVEDDGDLEPPEADELQAFVRACLAEFHPGSLFMRLGVIRLWKHVLTHLAEERLPAVPRLDAALGGELVAAVQHAALDDRSERLRRPAMELAATLSKDGAAGGGRELLLRGVDTPAAAGATMSPIALQEWLGRLDAQTLEQCAADVTALRAVIS